MPLAHGDPERNARGKYVSEVRERLLPYMRIHVAGLHEHVVERQSRSRRGDRGGGTSFGGLACIVGCLECARELFLGREGDCFKESVHVIFERERGERGKLTARLEARVSRVRGRLLALAELELCFLYGLAE
jgi:hypothetical protein